RSHRIWRRPTSSRSRAPGAAGTPWRRRDSWQQSRTFSRVRALVDDLQTHGPCGTSNHHHGGLDGVAVEVRHLQLGNLAYLSLCYAADLVTVGLTRTLLDPGFLFEKHRGRRRLQNEAEGLVREDRDLDRENRILALRPRIELFAEG